MASVSSPDPRANDPRDSLYTVLSDRGLHPGWRKRPLPAPPFPDSWKPKADQVPRDRSRAERETPLPQG